MNTYNKIQNTKEIVLRAYSAATYSMNESIASTDLKNSTAQDGMIIIRSVRDAAIGFASDVATTADKYERVSEKQAYVIARAAVENNLECVAEISDERENTYNSDARTMAMLRRMSKKSA